MFSPDESTITTPTSQQQTSSNKRNKRKKFDNDDNNKKDKLIDLITKEISKQEDSDYKFGEYVSKSLSSLKSSRNKSIIIEKIKLVIAETVIKDAQDNLNALQNEHEKPTETVTETAPSNQQNFQVLYPEEEIFANSIINENYNNDSEYEYEEEYL